VDFRRFNHDALLSTAGSEQPHELRDHLGLRRVVDERPLAAILDKLSPTKQIEMMRQGRAWNFQCFLDLSHRDLTLLTNQKEEDLEARPMGERLEGVGVPVGGLEPGQRERFHISEYMEI
jgi:hypothetical protein